ncbi:cation efflux protein [Colletotrichum phormii]|uniref:Cation efflux protein n=1 Tax=Colletotrichum phormii TaxID=359342 RepID=A0AAJ0EDR8_9PEZI|nr:cation efflux protein [Colletotrichum phormii]KAK1635003.1 cation efflux protein [Colletotrichum phormii]
MARFKINKKQRLVATIAISGGFFIAELVIGYRTKSLALIADAFHYMNDLIGFAVALIAVIVSERRSPPPKSLTFGWKRAQILGAFFNGVFLLALGVSILLQAFERFTQLPHVEDPVLVLIMGCIGLGLNVIVLSFLHAMCNESNPKNTETHHHEHIQERHPDEESREPPSHSPPPPSDPNTSSNPEPKPSLPSAKHHHTRPRDLNMLGVLLHVLTDALNNLSVIVAALIIWKSSSNARFYADPGVGVFIALTIMLSAWPLCRRAGEVLMESAPAGVDVNFVRGEILEVPGVLDIKDLLVWQLDQTTTLATAHITITGDSIDNFASTADAIVARLQQYGIRSVALQPTTTHRQSHQEVPQELKVA